jgi:hypothetical protein
MIRGREKGWKDKMKHGFDDGSSSVGAWEFRVTSGAYGHVVLDGYEDNIEH